MIRNVCDLFFFVCVVSVLSSPVAASRTHSLLKLMLKTRTSTRSSSQHVQQCPAAIIQVFPIDRDDSSKQGWTNPAEVIQHVCTFAGAAVDTSMPPDPQTGSVAGVIASPQNFPWVDTRQSHFGCWDGRSDHAVLGTPGGDMAEFILALNAVEHTRSLDQAYNQEKVDTIFKDWLAEIPGRFYLHTDAVGFMKWAEETKKRCDLTNPLKPKTPDQKQTALDIAPFFLRCTHLQLMMAKEDEYKVRKDLVENAIRAVLKVLMDDTNILRVKIEFEILTGYPNNEQAVVNILSPGPTVEAAVERNTDPRITAIASKTLGPPAHDPLSPCYYHAPMVVPRIENDPDKSIAVYHARAVYEKRGVYADYLMRQEQQGLPWRWKIFNLMNSIAKTQMELTKAEIYKDKHTYLASFLAFPTS